MRSSSTLEIIDQEWEQILKNIILLKDEPREKLERIIEQAKYLDVDHQQIRKAEIEMVKDENTFLSTGLKYENGSRCGVLFLSAIYNLFIKYRDNPEFVSKAA